ncbi:MAG: Translocator protein, LysE family [Parcubacteria group bacterium GW2011_GWC2_38_7]|nr:MAG: Translocator protein, LysE family [Parcubacteria group bacterium GW2011_GWC2_38_7]
MEILIKSLIAGFLVAAIPGAVQTTIFKASIDKQTSGALRFALGASFMDAMYMGFVYVGITKLLSYDFLINSVTLLGAFYIFYLGVDGLITSFRADEEIAGKERKFWHGALIVLLHPPTMLYFLSVVKSFTELSPTFVTMSFSVLAVFTGSFSCFIVVALIGIVVARYSTRYLITVFRVIASCLLVGFSIKLLIQFISG